MKRFLVVLLIIFFTVSIISVDIGCKKAEPYKQETKKTETTEVESTTSKITVSKIYFDSDRDGKIAFESDRDGNTEIYIMYVDGSEQTNLTNNPEHDGSPSFSPDGSKIVFVSYRDGNSEIYIMNADGSEQTRLTNNAADDGQPSFSPDGSKIAFESDRDGNTEIYIMYVDGSEQTRLTNNAADDLYPSFLSDGPKIAFESNRDGKYKIYTMNVDGSEQVKLTKGGGFAAPWAYSFSPSGSEIAFNYFYGNNHNVYAGRIDGTVIVGLTTDYADDGYPSFSPDGSKIAFESNRDGNYEIYVMGNFGLVQENLTNNPSNDRFPAFSPIKIETSRIENIPSEDLGDCYLYMSLTETGVEIESLRISRSSFTEYAFFCQGRMYEHRIGKLSEKLMEKLSRDIENSGFFNFEDVYECPENFSVEGTISLSVLNNGEIKSVHELGTDAPSSFYGLIDYLRGQIISRLRDDTRHGTFIKVEKYPWSSKSEIVISDEELKAYPLLAMAINNPGWFIYVDTLTNAGLDNYIAQDGYYFYLNYEGNTFLVEAYE